MSYESLFDTRSRVAVLYDSAALLLALVAAPVAGLICARGDLSILTEMPPRSILTSLSTTGLIPAAATTLSHDGSTALGLEDFNPLIFWPLILFELAIIAFLASKLSLRWRRIGFRVDSGCEGAACNVSPFHLWIRGIRESFARMPYWGWCAAVCLALSWFAAWSKSDLLAPVRYYTFFPLWLSFIVFLNGCTTSLRGSCVMTRRPWAFSSLFLLSALFWWYFEFLNRFVCNWIYLAVSHFGPWEYAILATACFSTVLPAVISMSELLSGLFAPVGPKGQGLQPQWAGDSMVCRGKGAVATGIAIYLVAVGGLFAMGAFPRELFWLLWTAPLAIFSAVDLWRGREDLICPALFHGRWYPIAILAISGLVCGFFWELWNYRSLAKWIYVVPYVGEYRLFEMPIAGYGGYLPFGIECWLVARLVLGRKELGRLLSYPL